VSDEELMYVIVWPWQTVTEPPEVAGIVPNVAIGV
jgi:hypothetical protein